MRTDLATLRTPENKPVPVTTGNSAGACFTRKTWALLWGAVAVVGGLLSYIFLDGPADLHAKTVLVSGDGAAASAPRLPKLVVTYRDARPDMVVYSDGWHGGPIRLITEEAAKRIGYAVEWKQASFSKSIAALEEGAVDIVPFIFYKTPEREKEFLFSSSLGMRPRPVYFVVKKDGDAARGLRAFGDLKRFKVGYREKSYYFKEFHKAGNISKLPFDKLSDLADGFVRGKIDVMAVTDKLETERLFTTVGFNDYAYAELRYEMVSDMYYFYSKRKDHSEVMRRFDEAVVKMKNEGVIGEIYRSFDIEPPKGSIVD